ncbi:MAG: hypothetical protein ACYS6W_12045 [Planctomycetota bacterium]|jgi:hypothetical protein
MAENRQEKQNRTAARRLLVDSKARISVPANKTGTKLGSTDTVLQLRSILDMRLAR